MLGKLHFRAPIIWYGAQRARYLMPGCNGTVRSRTQLQSIYQSINKTAFLSRVLLHVHVNTVQIFWSFHTMRINSFIFSKTLVNQVFILIFQYISNKLQRYTVYFIWKLLYIFRVVLSPIIRSANNCIYSIWYLSHRYCYLPLSWKSWNRFECAVGGEFKS